MAYGVPPPCGPNDPPTWCDPRMVAMKLRDADGVMDVRLEEGARTFFKSNGWTGPVEVRVDREKSVYLKVTIWIPGKTGPLKSGRLKKGDEISIVPGVDVPQTYLGPSHKAAVFVANE